MLTCSSSLLSQAFWQLTDRKEKRKQDNSVGDVKVTIIITISTIDSSARCQLNIATGNKEALGLTVDNHNLLHRRRSQPTVTGEGHNHRILLACETPGIVS